MSIVAFGLIAKHWKACEFSALSYWRFLGHPWRLITFGVAWGLLVWMAPRSGDPTWDWIDASIMSVLTFATAPWAMVVFYGLRRRTPPLWKLYVAFVLAMLSASWSYDGYLLIRDGFYPASWLDNAIASMVLYVSAGLFWSVDGHSVRKVVFVFTLDRGFEEAENSFSGYMLAIAAPFAFLVTYLLSIFVPELS